MLLLLQSKQTQRFARYFFFLNKIQVETNESEQNEQKTITRQWNKRGTERDRERERENDREKKNSTANSKHEKAKQ